MENNLKEKIGKCKDIVDLIANTAKLGTFTIGGICWVKYINEIGHFPEGVNIGDGITMYLLTSGFLFIYGVFLIGTTSLGSLLMSFLLPLIEKGLCFWRKWRKSQSRRKENFVIIHQFERMREGYLIAPSIIGVLLILMISKSFSQLLLLITCAAAQGIFYGVYLQSDKNASYNKFRLAASNSSTMPNEAGQLVKFKFIIMAVIVSIPSLFATKFSNVSFVDAAFNFSHLRKENATIHVKAPWSYKINRGSNISSISFLGKDYLEFKGIKVLLQSIGSSVVIELPAGKDKVVSTLAIPKDAIFVE